MGPTWVLSAPDGPHVGHMNFAIWDHFIDSHRRHDFSLQYDTGEIEQNREMCDTIGVWLRNIPNIYDK